MWAKYLPPEIMAQLKAVYPGGPAITLNLAVDLDSVLDRPLDVSLTERMAIASAPPAQALAALLELMGHRRIDSELLRLVGPSGRQRIVDWCYSSIFPGATAPEELRTLIEQRVVKP